jgi:transposase
MAEAYVPLSFAPGEAYQFDWSYEVVLINGTTVTVKVAHVRLCHSRMLFVRAYPRETQEMVFDAHNRAFAFFKGTCTRGIYDNMKTAVETVFIGKDRQFNRRFVRMCGHYLVEPTACTPASGWEKGQSLPSRKRGSRTRSGWCASASSRRGYGWRATRS